MVQQMHSSHVECNAPLLYRRFLALCYSRAWVAPAFNNFHVVTGGPGSDVLSVLVSFTSLSLSYLTLPVEQIIQKYIKFLWNSARQGMLVGDTKQLWELPKPVTGPPVRNLNGNTASGICSGLLMNWYFTVLPLDRCWAWCCQSVCFKVLSLLLTYLCWQIVFLHKPHSLVQSRHKNWKDHSFLPRFGKGAERILGCSSSPLFSRPLELLCIFKGKRNLHSDFLMSEWQQKKMDFNSNSHTSILNNWYFINQYTTWESSSSKLCVKFKCKPFKYCMYALVLHLHSDSVKDSW